MVEFRGRVILFCIVVMKFMNWANFDHMVYFSEESYATESMLMVFTTAAVMARPYD